MILIKAVFVFLSVDYATIMKLNKWHNIKNKNARKEASEKHFINFKEHVRILELEVEHFIKQMEHGLFFLCTLHLESDVK